MIRSGASIYSCNNGIAISCQAKRRKEAKSKTEQESTALRLSRSRSTAQHSTAQHSTAAMPFLPPPCSSAYPHEVQSSSTGRRSLVSVGRDKLKRRIAQIGSYLSIPANRHERASERVAVSPMSEEGGGVMGPHHTASSQTPILLLGRGGPYSDGF